MKYLLIGLIWLQSSVGFSQKEDSLISVFQSYQLEFLHSPESHKNYLETIFRLDQEIRNSSTLILQKEGNKSDEYFNVIERQKEIDRSLFNVMVEYLSKYGHPSKQLGEIACYTPQLIFHHVSGTSEDLELKERYFPIFYQAYTSGVINSNSIYFYLYRLYSQVMDETYNSELNENEQIEELIQLLDLKKE